MRRRPSVGFWVLVIVLTVVFVAPLLWMMITSFKTIGEAQQTPPTLIPHNPTGRAYGEVLTTGGQNPVLTWFLNSVAAATLHAGLVVLVASMAGYALARMEFRFKKPIFALILATLFVPGFVFLMPNYLLMDKLSWLDTLWALVVPGAAGAFGVFFMRQFFLALPRELEEVAMIDGANAGPCSPGSSCRTRNPRWRPSRCCRSWRTGTTSSGRSMCSSRPNGSRCRPA